jgi:integration host factor subunit alpha
MIKEDITKSIMRDLGLDHQQSKQTVESILDIFKENLSKGDDIMVSGFGRFMVKNKKERVGRNPKTKEIFPISQRTVVTFIPSKVFREELNPEG